MNHLRPADVVVSSYKSNVYAGYRIPKISNVTPHAVKCAAYGDILLWIVITSDPKNGLDVLKELSPPQRLGQKVSFYPAILDVFTHPLKTQLSINKIFR